MSESSLSKHLVGRGTSPSDFASAISGVTDLACESIYGARSHLKAGDSFMANALKVEDVDLSRPLGSLAEALDELRTVWLDRAVYYHHDRYLSHLNCPVATPAVAAELLATSLNTAVESWDQATAAVDIEQSLIRWIASRLGLPTEANGVFTSGGTQSNLQALTIARNKTRSTIREASGGNTAGLLSKLAVFVSPTAHYSIRRATDLLGLEPDNIKTVATRPSGQLDPCALANSISAARRDGLVPTCVVATAGTTDRGIIDPLTEIGKLCIAQNIHFHVDAAYGGAASVSREHCSRIAGIELADSVTVDFHKTFYQPLACSAVVVRDHRDLSHVRWNAEYLNPQDAKLINLADFSLQTTRRFDALKLWVTLRTVGEEAIGAAFDNTISVARSVATLIDTDPAFELYEQPSLSTVLFSLTDDPAGVHTEALRDELFNSGIAAIAITRIDKRRLMKFTILDPSLQLDTVSEVLRDIAQVAHQLRANGFKFRKDSTERNSCVPTPVF